MPASSGPVSCRSTRPITEKLVTLPQCTVSAIYVFIYIYIFSFYILIFLLYCFFSLSLYMYTYIYIYLTKFISVCLSVCLSVVFPSNLPSFHSSTHLYINNKKKTYTSICPFFTVYSFYFHLVLLLSEFYSIEINLC